MRIPGLCLDGPLDGLPWRATRVPGVEWIDLHGPGPAANDAMTVLIRMAPGAGYPPHLHLGIEDVLVLVGGYADGDGQRFVAGDFVRYPADSSHAPTALGDPGRPAGKDNPACVLYAVAHAGTRVLGSTQDVRAARDVDEP